MTASSDDRDGNGTWRGFPGGNARLPRLSRTDLASDGPDVMFVESAFLHDQGEGSTGDSAAASGFEAYYSAESLYDPIPTGSDPNRDEGPYALLGLTASASWEEVSRSHRSLVSELHPDRYVDADDTVCAAAERRVRDVNEAFATIRRERSGRTR